MNSVIQYDSNVASEKSLINAIYDAALHPHLWSEVLNAIRELCNTSQCTLFYYDRFDRQQNYAAAARLKLQTLDLYLDEFIAPQAAQFNNELIQIPDATLVTDEDIHQLTGKHYAEIVGAKYMRCLWPNLEFQAGIVLFRSESCCAGVGLQNFCKSHTISKECITQLQKLIPHFIQAIQIRQRIILLERANNAIEKILQNIQLGVLLLDQNEKLVFINEAAEKAFSKCMKIHYKLHQPLQIRNSDKEQSQSITTIKNSTKKYKRKITEPGTAIKIDYQNGHLKIRFFSLDNSSNDVLNINKRFILPSQIHYLVLVQDSNRPCELPIDYLQQAYGITGAECELISHIVNGNSLVEAAKKREVTHETARWQMKNIMQKTQIHSQNELSNLMLSLSDV